MKWLVDILGIAQPEPGTLPACVRSIEEIGGVRVLRLQGSVGKEIGDQVKSAYEQPGLVPTFARPLLIDFAGTRDWDFSTISYMVHALRKRMSTGARVGLINASPQLITELTLAKLDGLFRVFPSEQQAIADLGRP